MKLTRFETIFILAAVTAVSIMVLTGAVCLVADADEKRVERVRNEEIDRCESEYIGSVKTVLAGHGLKNSGVTVTKITEDGIRDYSVNIYNGKLSCFEENEIANIEKEIRGLDTSFTEGEFEISFLSE